MEKLDFISIRSLKLYAFSIFAFFLGTGLEKMTVLSLLLLVVVSFLDINKKKEIDKKDQNITFLFLGFYLFIVLYSVLFVEYKYIERNISFVLFPLICFYLNKEEIRSVDFTKKVCFSFSSGLIVYPIFIIVSYVLLKTPTETGFPLELSSFYQLKRIVFSTNIYNHIFHNVYYAAYSICAMVFLYFFQKESKYKFIVFGFILLHLFFILLSAGRMSYLLLSLLVVLYIVGHVYNKNKKIFYFVPVLLFFFVFLFNKYPYLQHKFVKSLPDSISVRLAIWENSYEISKSNMMGMGFNGFHNLLNVKNQQEFLEIAEFLNAHNQYIEYFGVLGVFGGVYFILLMSYIIKVVVRDKNITLMLFMLFMLLSFVTESWFVRQYGIVFFMFFLCFFWNKKDN